MMTNLPTHTSGTLGQPLATAGSRLALERSSHEPDLYSERKRNDAGQRGHRYYPERRGYLRRQLPG